MPQEVSDFLFTILIDLTSMDFEADSIVDSFLSQRELRDYLIALLQSRIIRHQVPQQGIDSNDCGIYVLQYMKYLSLETMSIPAITRQTREEVAGEMRNKKINGTLDVEQNTT